jgi:hypothetical protein
MKYDAPQTEYTQAELDVMLAKMQQASAMFYNSATQIGNHPFIEFCGLMNEYITVCHKAREQGIDFALASTHTGKGLPFEHYNAAYLAEKLNCIYGPSLLQNEELRDAFIGTLFGGEYVLRPSIEKLAAEQVEYTEFRWLEDLYRRVMQPTDIPNFAGWFTVRLFDGMDGCWCDLDEATNVTGDVALKVWSKKTKKGTKKVAFSEIDYFRIFPEDTRMTWDGSEGREMFR